MSAMRLTMVFIPIELPSFFITHPLAITISLLYVYFFSFYFDLRLHFFQSQKKRSKKCSAR